MDQRSCKAARALLGWTASDLASASGVSLDTLRSFESRRSRTLNRENEAAVLQAFDGGGVVFIPENGGGVGVRLKVPDSGGPEAAGHHG